MEKFEEFQSERIGTVNYVNKNCFLAKTLNRPPTKHCRYCELKLSNCPFCQYLIVSLILIFFSLGLSSLIEGGILKPVIVITFVFLVIYGYLFIKITEKLIETKFAHRKVKEALEEAKTVLAIKVRARTRALEEERVLLEEKVKQRTKEIQEKMEELERFNRLAVGRELKMIELKEEIKKLKEELEESESRER